MAYAVQATTHHQTYPERPPGAKLRPKKVNNLEHAATLLSLKRFGEVKSLFRKTMPVARRVFGEVDSTTLRMRTGYATALYYDPGATLDDLREAVTTLEDTDPIARRVFGGTHPITTRIERSLQIVRAALRARKTPSPGSA